MIETWKTLTDLNQFDEIDNLSNEKPVVLFKHSTRCGISLHAKDKLESKWDFTESDLDFYYLDLLNYRNLSNHIAEKYSVIHQSPQIVIVKNGKAVYDVSHGAISVDVIKQHL